MTCDELDVLLGGRRSKMSPKEFIEGKRRQTQLTNQRWNMRSPDALRSLKRI